MTSAVGTKKNTAAMSQRLIEEGPLCAAAAIQRGPRTVAMLKSRTSHKPMTRGSLGRRPGMELTWLTMARGLHLWALMRNARRDRRGQFAAIGDAGWSMPSRL